VSFILDTCAVSDLRKDSPNAGLAAWLKAQDPADLFLSVMTLGELHKGLERLPQGPKKAGLKTWIERIESTYKAKILPINLATMRIWGQITARAAQQGRTLPALDAIIAAAALEHDMAIVTRNVGDFEPAGPRVINPFT